MILGHRDKKMIIMSYISIPPLNFMSTSISFIFRKLILYFNLRDQVIFCDILPYEIQVKSPNTQRSAGRLTSWEKKQHNFNIPKLQCQNVSKKCQIGFKFEIPKVFFNLSETKLLRWQCCTACTPELNPPHYSNRNHLGNGNYSTSNAVMTAITAPAPALANALPANGKPKSSSFSSGCSDMERGYLKS